MLATIGRPRTATRLAPAIWGIAGACWVITVAGVLLGLDVHGHHDAVLAEAGPLWHWRLAGFAAAWIVMIGAMMLPSATPLIELFWVASANQARPAPARIAMLTPYFLIWLGFGGLALAGDAAVHIVVDSWTWLAARSDLLLGGALMLAGGFQFSRLKKACLTSCRTPEGMLRQHYDRGIPAAWRLGIRHGLVCLGCCWALMLVMFGAGAGSLVWMLLLTPVMIVEKVAPWGDRLVIPAGVALLAAGAAISFHHILVVN